MPSDAYQLEESIRQAFGIGGRPARPRLMPPTPETRSEDTDSEQARNAMIGGNIASALPQGQLSRPGFMPPDMEPAPNVQPTAAERARGIAAGLLGRPQLPAVPASNSPQDLAAFAGGQPGPTGYVSPGGPNVNGVLASRALPERRLNEQEYAAIHGQGGQAFPSFMSMQAGGSNAPSAAAAAMPGNVSPDLRQLQEQMAAVTSMIGPRPTSGGTLEGVNHLAERTADWNRQREALLARFGGLGSERTAQQNANTNLLGVQNAGRTDQTAADNRGAAAYQTALAASFQNHPERSASEHHQYAQGLTGIPTERYLQLTSATPLHPSSSPATPAPVIPGSPAVRPGVNAQGISTVREGATETPFANIERVLNRSSGYVPASPATGSSAATPEVRPTASVGEFINKLETNNPGMLAQNYPAIRNYMISRYGESAVEAAESASGNSRQLDPDGIQAILNPLRRVRQALGGPNDDERGLSVLGSLRQAIQSAGSHAEFLRRQRPPTP